MPHSTKTRDLTHKANVIIYKNNPKTKLALYHHTCCYSLTLSNFIKVIQNDNFLFWSGLKNKIIAKHLPPTITTSNKNNKITS